MSGGRLVVGDIATSHGTYTGLFSPTGLARLAFPGEGAGPCRAWAERWWPGVEVVEGGDGHSAAAAAQLSAYFDGRLRRFDLPLDLRGTPFQLAVWQALAQIPYGETQSYAEVAATIGRPRAVRAVGRANGANPVPIVVPCHRVIGSSGQLVGFGGGLDLKRELLALEARTVEAGLPANDPAGVRVGGSGACRVDWYPVGSVPDGRLAFAVVVCRSDGKLVLVRHRDRTTWEVPGGHREAGETIDQAAATSNPLAGSTAAK